MAVNQPEGGSFGTEPRELIPTLVDSDDLMHKIGSLSVDILNKEKVIRGLWVNVDELSKKTSEFKGVLEENNSLKETVERVEAEKVALKEVESQKRINLKSELHQEILQKAEQIRSLEKTLKTIEADSIINQEELRKELMVSREALKKSKLVIQQQKVKKKAETNAKARA